jgi:hypothetical protein
VVILFCRNFKRNKKKQLSKNKRTIKKQKRTEANF